MPLADGEYLSQPNDSEPWTVPDGMSCDAQDPSFALVDMGMMSPLFGAVIDDAGELVARFNPYIGSPALADYDNRPTDCPLRPILKFPERVEVYAERPNRGILKGGAAVGETAVNIVRSMQADVDNFPTHKPSSSAEVAETGCPKDCPRLGKSPELQAAEKRAYQLQRAADMRAEADAISSAATQEDK
ncbi:hypothetical protein KBC31_00285 [Candidatus Saccharibacteria bacterium]|nr:hypothetical protein [Candidatus Saccharibacteria bacterium]